jgi:hypothetical protein
MAIEYIYWSIVSNMGILDDPQTASGIADEWELYSPLLLQNTDTLIYNLITDPQYQIPQLAPDGNYCPNSTSITDINNSKKIIRITDFLGRDSKPYINIPLFYIYDDYTVEKKIIIE